MQKEQKAEIINQVSEKFKKAQGVYLLEFEGTTVEQSSSLRDLLRKEGIEYQVVKNTLIKKSMEKAGFSNEMYPALKKTTGVVFGYDDPIAPARILKKVFQSNEKLKFKAASIEGKMFGASSLNQIAGMSSRIDNIAKVAGLMNQVIAGTPTVIHAVMRNLVYVISEGTKKNS